MYPYIERRKKDIFIVCRLCKFEIFLVLIIAILKVHFITFT